MPIRYRRPPAGGTMRLCHSRSLPAPLPFLKRMADGFAYRTLVRLRSAATFLKFHLRNQSRQWPQDGMRRRTELIDERGTRPDKPMKPGWWPTRRGFGKRRCGAQGVPPITSRSAKSTCAESTRTNSSLQEETNRVVGGRPRPSRRLAPIHRAAHHTGGLAALPGRRLHHHDVRT
jgi:hypothetical protein